MAYKYVQANGVTQREHRVLLGLVGKDPNIVVHHKDGNVANNNSANLAVMTREEHTALHNQLQPQRAFRFDEANQAICRKCGIRKPREEFVRNRSWKSGYSSVCKQCNNKYMREWKANHRN